MAVRSSQGGSFDGGPSQAELSRRPLVVTSDPELLDDLTELAAAAGVELEVVGDPVAARPRFATAPIVVVGTELAHACARGRLRRRSGVVIVSRDAGTPTFDGADAMGAEYVVALPAAKPWLIERLSEAGAAPDKGHTVAVLGGRGGAGVSVFAAALAVTAARQGQRTLLIDADPLGGGADLVLGWESLEGLRWPSRSTSVAVEQVPSRGNLSVLAWGRDNELAMTVEPMAATLAEGRASADLVVVDVPRYLDDSSVVALTQADRVLLLVPAELRACAAAKRVAEIARSHARSLELVVCVPSPGNLRAPEIAQSLRLPLAGVLRREPGLARTLERGSAPAGSGRGALATLCRELLAGIGRRDQVVRA